MKINILTIFPEMFAPLRMSMLGRAIDNGIIELNVTDIRDYTTDKHNRVDDTPYGGGAGLVMKCGPIFAAYQDLTSVDLGIMSANASENEQPRTGPAPRHADGVKPKTIFLTPCGRRFDDAFANELAEEHRLLFVCGHYEGIDERVYELADYQISLGDYVVTSGELASMIVIDAVVRKIVGMSPKCSSQETMVLFRNGATT